MPAKLGSSQPDIGGAVNFKTINAQATTGAGTAAGPTDAGPHGLAGSCTGGTSGVIAFEGSWDGSTWFEISRTGTIAAGSTFALFAQFAPFAYYRGNVVTNTGATTVNAWVF